MVRPSYNFLKHVILRSPAKPFKNGANKFQELLKLEKEACFLASPSLINGLNKKSKEVDASTDLSLKLAFKKYQTRMQTRCTPYGLFAANTVINWAKESTIKLSNPNCFNRTTKLDMQYWGALIKEISVLPEIKQVLKYCPNTSLYPLADKLRYVEYTYKDKIRKYHIASIDNSTYLNTLLVQATGGATFDTLVNGLIKEGVENNDAVGFINDVIEAQVLISELEPTTTGNEYMEFVLGKLLELNKAKKCNVLTRLTSTLELVQKKLIALDNNKINDITAYTDIENQLQALNIPIEEGKLFQVDMFKKPLVGTINNSYQKNLLKVISFLGKIPLQKNKTVLDGFRERFYKKYENKELLLLEALDNETGVGYLQSNGDNTPLVDDIYLPAQEEDNKIAWGQWMEFLQNKVETCLVNNKSTLELTDKQLEQLNLAESNTPKLPDTLAVMFSHIDDNTLQLHSIGGSSAGNLLGRFANASDKINDILQTITKAESELNPNAILAEIVHLPESRTGNILHRPQLREYEIPYLAQSSLPKKNQIAVSDLVISVHNDRVFLRSKKHNKEVLPRLTNAHNYSFNALPVYQFLCDMQTQDNAGGLYFSWGALEGMYSFLPRVVYQNIILAPATWQLKKKAFEHLLKVKDDALLKETDVFRNKHNMPQSIAIADGDNELMIDLEDFWSVKMMLDTIKNRKAVKLIEFLFDPETAIVRDVEGNPYTNQFIAFLIKEKPEEQKSVPMETKDYKITNIKVQRSFSLGSEWLYYKIYCGYKTADRVLSEIIKPLTEQLLEQNQISQWFFIRYADPDPHIRVRFKLNDTKHVGNVINQFSKQIAQFEQWGLVWKIQTDTYKRELERYGNNSIVLAEQLFYYDSVATANMIDLIEGDAGEIIRWKYCIRAIDELLTGFGYSLTAKRDLLESLKTGFAQEFNMNRDLKKQIDKKFRDNRTAIEEVLDRTKDATSELLPLFKILEHKNTQENPVIASLLKLEKNNELMLPINKLLSSFIHMLVNRLFKSKQRVHELVVYDFMYRHYRSFLAKQQNKQKEKH